MRVLYRKKLRLSSDETKAWGDADGRPAVESAAAPPSLSLAVWIEALRPIAAGEEILVSYGAHYPLPGDATDDAHDEAANDTDNAGAS